jgi:hypothetical protein
MYIYIYIYIYIHIYIYTYMNINICIFIFAIGNGRPFVLEVTGAYSAISKGIELDFVTPFVAIFFM